MNGRPVLPALPRDRDDGRQTGYEQMHAMPVPEQHQQHNRTESAHGSPTRGGLQPSHVLLFVLLGLVLVIGSTVGALTWRSTSLERSIPAWESADPAAGYAFYDELRQFLAGDQTADLRGVVTTGFLDHTSDQEEPRDIEDLTTELTTFGATFPGTLLTIDSISISGNSLVVMISGTMSPVGSVAGLGLSPIRLPATIEILHTHQGRVSERWAAALPPISAVTFDAGATSSFAGGVMNARLFRIDLPADGEVDWVSGMQSIVLVEAGTLSLTTQATGDRGGRQSHQTTIASGTAMVLPGKAPVRLRSDGTHDTRLLLLDVQSRSADVSPPFIRLGGATSTFLWEPSPLLQLGEPWSLQAGKLELPAGTTIQLESRTDLEILLAVDRSPITLGHTRGTSTHLEASYAMGPFAAPGTVDVGTAVQLSGVTRAGLQTADGRPSTIWVVTFGPIDSATATATSQQGDRPDDGQRRNPVTFLAGHRFSTYRSLSAHRHHADVARTNGAGSSGRN